MPILDTPGPPGPIEYPEYSNEKIALKWTAPVDDGGSVITNYVVAKREVGKGTWSNVTSSISRTNYTVQGLMEKATYEFKVCAENIYGTGDPSFGDPIMAKNPFDPPDAPRSCRVKEVTRSGVKLEWEKPTRDGGRPIKGYIIEKRNVMENSWHKVNRVPIPETTAFVDDVIEDEVYEFRVMALNEAGLSKPSDCTSPAVKIEDPPSKRLIARVIDFSFKFMYHTSLFAMTEITAYCIKYSQFNFLLRIFCDFLHSSVQNL